MSNRKYLKEKISKEKEEIKEEDNTKDKKLEENEIKQENDKKPEKNENTSSSKGIVALEY